MSKNTIQFQKGIGLQEMIANYGSEEQCEAALFVWRWPNGFQCPRCGSSQFLQTPQESKIPVQPLSPTDIPDQQHHF